MANELTEYRLRLPDMTVDQLRAELANHVRLTAEHVARMAVIWTELERRGEDMKALRMGLSRFLPAVAAGKLVPEAVVHLSGNMAALRAIGSLIPEEQRRLLSEGALPVERDGSIVAVPLLALSSDDTRRAIDPVAGRVIPPSEQREPKARRRNSGLLTHRITIPVTADEHKKLQAAATRSKVSASDLVRTVLRQHGEI
jgi:hypothetical protein